MICLLIYGLIRIPVCNLFLFYNDRKNHLNPNIDTNHGKHLAICIKINSLNLFDFILNHYLKTCSCDISIGSLNTIHCTDSVNGGVVSEP